MLTRPSRDIQAIVRLLSSRDARAFLSGLPARQLAPLGGAVFALFASVGFLLDISEGGAQPPHLLAVDVIFTGAIAAAYGYAGLRTIPWRVAAIAVHAAYLVTVNLLSRDVDAAAPDMDRLRLDAFAVMACLTVSYTLVVRFIGTTGVRYLNDRAEIRLASEIHAVLVPVIHTRIGEYEFFGVSRASGDVGGDLVDLVSTLGDTGWIAYLADVSGHGVSSGVLMGMTKSSARTHLRSNPPLSSLLRTLNEVLLPLKQSSMYVTFAGVHWAPDGTLEFAVAGHLPILHLGRHGGIREATTPQIPVGMFENYPFTSASLSCEPGDLLVLLTDGITEVFDAHDEEYGLDRVKAYLQAHAAKPLPMLAEGLLHDASQHGTALDDQTLLLIRRDRERGGEPIP